MLLRIRQFKACSEVKKHLLLHLSANSAALAQANGSIGFVGGAAAKFCNALLASTLAKACDEKYCATQETHPGIISPTDGMSIQIWPQLNASITQKKLLSVLSMI